MKKVTLSRILVFAFIGLITGGILGETLGWLFFELGKLANTPPEHNYAYNLLVKAFFSPSFGFGNPEGLVVDLYMIKFKIGLALKLNAASLLGLLIAFYIERWSRAH